MAPAARKYGHISPEMIFELPSREAYNVRLWADLGRRRRSKHRFNENHLPDSNSVEVRNWDSVAATAIPIDFIQAVVGAVWAWH
jgi:hypothetical protein